MSKVAKAKRQKDSNGGKLGQFTTEVYKTKLKWFWKGFTSINWIIALGAFVAGIALGLSV